MVVGKGLYKVGLGERELPRTFIVGRLLTGGEE